MRILIFTPSFLPNIGGVETISEILAEEFVRAGHEVIVVCNVSVESEPTTHYRVVRKPSFLELLRCVKWAEVVMHMNVSLKGLLPVMLMRRKWIAAHHGWYSWPERSPSIIARLKLMAARWLATENIAVSQAVSNYLSLECFVIPNPYDARYFFLMPEIPRDRDLLFVGRLVSDKAPDLLLNAVKLLTHHNLSPTVTITGSGNEEESLRAQVKQLGLSNQVEFTGPKRGRELAEVMNAHRIIVVPSRIREGFGLVALEGIACGCIPVVADAGGLLEAIGNCGLMFNRDDAVGLAGKLRTLLEDASKAESLLGFRAPHLAKASLSSAAAKYVDVFNMATKS